MAETPRPDEGKTLEDIGNLTSDEYRKKLREGELPDQKESAKLTLGGESKEFFVTSEDEQKKAREQEEAISRRQSELDKQRKSKKSKGRAKRPPKPGPVDIKEMQEEERRVEAGRKNKSAEEYAEDLVDAIFDSGEKKGGMPKPPEKVKKEEMEREIEEVKERQKQRRKKTRESEVEQPAEQEVRPWAKLEREEYSRLYQQYIEGAEFSRELRSSVTKILDKDIDQKRGEFLLEWFEENKHRKEVKERGVSLDVSDDRKRAIAIEMGANMELVSDKRYKKDFEYIENLSALRMDFGAENIPLESQFLMLNHLEGKAKKLRLVVENLKDVSGEAEAIKRESAEKELEKLFQIRKELAEKATGQPLEKQAKEELEKTNPLESKDEYIQKHLILDGETGAITENNKARLRELWQQYDGLQPDKKIDFCTVQKRGTGSGNKPREFLIAQNEEDLKGLMLENLKVLGVNINEEAFLTLLNSGYKLQDAQRKGFFRERIEILNTRTGQLESVRPKDFDEFISRKKVENRLSIEADEKKKLGEEWDAKNKERPKKVRELIEQKISGFSLASEKAKGEAVRGVEAVYARIRNRLIEEYNHRKESRKAKKTAKAPKTAENVSEPEEAEESKKEVKLTGDIKKDAKKIMEFLKESGQEDWGIDIQDVKNTSPKLYEEALKKKKHGIMAVVMHLLIGIQREI